MYLWMNYSVLMSVYNKENPQFLEESIESMLNQTVPSDDFVLVCDGPLTTDLNKVIEKYKSKLHIVRLDKNEGLGSALNKGLEYCKYELVARMDSDDISTPERCEKQLKMFDAIANLSLLSATISEFSGTTNNIVGKRQLPSTNEQIRKSSKKRNPFNHPAVMFRKNIVQTVGGYSEKYHLFEDYYLWIRILKSEAVVANIEESLVYMRVPVEMYQRRGGIQYAKDMLSFRWWMYTSGWSGFGDFIVSAIPQTLVCLMPNFLRKKFYQLLHTKT